MARRDRIRRGNIAALMLLAIGSTQFIGSALHSTRLRNFGAATVMAPMPQSLGDNKGLETFASEFTLGYWEPNGTEHSLKITPELFAQVEGPYARRAMYYNALAFAPRLPDALWTPVLCFGLGKKGPLRRELGLRPEQRDLTLSIRTHTRGRNDSWTFAPSCTR